jgi:hypothetical protein
MVGQPNLVLGFMPDRFHNERVAQQRQHFVVIQRIAVAADHR